MMSPRKNQRARRLGRIERDLLQELSGGDMLYGMLLSGRSSKRMFKLAHERARYRYKRSLAIARMQEHGFVQRVGERLEITASGKSALESAIERTRELLTHKAWDGKWRIVTFDIPEKYRRLRGRVRDILKRAGFVQMQQSLWIFPHDCRELAELIQEESQLSKYILYGVLDSIGEDKRIRNVFGL